MGEGEEVNFSLVDIDQLMCSIHTILYPILLLHGISESTERINVNTTH